MRAWASPWLPKPRIATGPICWSSLTLRSSPRPPIVASTGWKQPDTGYFFLSLPGAGDRLIVLQSERLDSAPPKNAYARFLLQYIHDS